MTAAIRATADEGASKRKQPGRDAEAPSPDAKRQQSVAASQTEPQRPRHQQQPPPGFDEDDMLRHQEQDMLEQQQQQDEAEEAEWNWQPNYEGAPPLAKQPQHQRRRLSPPNDRSPVPIAAWPSWTWNSVIAHTSFWTCCPAGRM